MYKKIDTIIGTFNLYTKDEDCGWEFKTTCRNEAEGIEILDVELSPIGEAESVTETEMLVYDMEQSIERLENVQFLITPS